MNVIQKVELMLKRLLDIDMVHVYYVYVAYYIWDEVNAILIQVII